jgi:hypothetical protein
MLCLGMHRNVMHRYMVQAFLDPPLCGSTELSHVLYCSHSTRLLAATTLRNVLGTHNVLKCNYVYLVSYHMFSIVATLRDCWRPPH